MSGSVWGSDVESASGSGSAWASDAGSASGSAWASDAGSASGSGSAWASDAGWELVMPHLYPGLAGGWDEESAWGRIRRHFAPKTSEEPLTEHSKCLSRPTAQHFRKLSPRAGRTACLFWLCRRR